MDLNCCPDEDGLPVLQLRKWGPSDIPYNLSDYREGFISPTRKSVLLLSYDSEALLIPLDKGQSMNNEDPQVTSKRTSIDPYESSIPNDSRENMFGVSEYLDSDNDIGNTAPTSSPRCEDAFISDIRSVAWGLCGDSCDQLDESSFRELLFVSGKDGLVVHAFSPFNESSETTRLAQRNDVGKGTWVEWGPSAAVTHVLGVHDESKSYMEASEESINTSQVKAAEDGQSESRKIWMRTFLTEAEIVKSGNDVYTGFPKWPSFPKDSIVSFRIFDRDSQLSNHGIKVMGPKTSKPDVDVGLSNTEVENDGMGHAERCLYNCVKVFSNDSYQLVGFALAMINPRPVNILNVDGDNCSKVLVSVARIVSWGMQWLYTVNVDEDNVGGPFEWLDFAFSHIFLICLSASGLIALYGATNGEYIAAFDVLNIIGPALKVDTDVPNEKSSHQLRSLDCERRFTRLFAFPYSSLIGGMDECGVIHVIDSGNHVPADDSLFENFLPYEYCPELGLLARWVVGGTDIGHQRVLLNKSSPHDLARLQVQGEKSYDSGRLGRKENQRHENIGIKDWRNLERSYITTPYDANQIMDQKKFVFSNFPSCLTRKVFLPLYRYREDDIICCSPFGVTRLIRRHDCEKKWYQIVHSNLQLDFIVNDEKNYITQGSETSTNEAVGCNFHGFLYLLTEKGLSVVIPSISVPSDLFPVEAIVYGIPKCTSSLKSGAGNLLGIDRIKRPWSPWKVEVLDRTLLYEGPEVAEKLCLENGWDLRISRIRRLQLAFSLERLMGVNLAVEGILRLLFAATYLMFNKVSGDNEVSAASRLLALATGYAIRVMRKCGLLQHKKAAVHPWNVIGNEGFPLLLELTDKEHDEEEFSRILKEIAQLLVVIRSLQGKLNAKFKLPGQQLTDNTGPQNLVSGELSEDEPKDPVVTEDTPFDTSDHREIALPASGTELSNAENLALVPADSRGETPGFDNFGRTILVSEGNAFGKTAYRVESSKDMMTRWALDNMDIKTVVKDALLSGRLPLAVLRLHLHHLSLAPGTESHDTFNDVRIAGRAIAYDLFVKGEVGLAITTLQKLGEDVETTLKQLVFGTVRRSLRVQIVEEMKKYAYLGPHELKILDMVSLIERVYPCNSFFSTLATRRKALSIVTNEDAAGKISLRLFHPLFDNLAIFCGEIDGVVLGSWKTIDEHSVAPEADDDSSHAAYWTAAAVWSDAWDQKVIDRILLDQPLLMGVNVLWESQLEYHVCHNDWLEVSKLLEVIPLYALSHGSLSISLDDIEPASSIEHGQELPGYKNYTGFLEELDGVFLNVPRIRFFRFSANKACSEWLKMLLEQQLAKEFIFLVEYWNDTSEIVPLLARSGFMINKHDQPFLDGADDSSSSSLLVIDDTSMNPQTVQALHKVVIHFCTQYNLLNLLDIYLDHHKLAIDHTSLSFLLNATGDNEWAKCLLLLRIKGKEYDASFSNARAVASRNLIPGNKLTVLETDDIIQAVDDIAEGAGEMAALATLMFAPNPLQECLSSGSVKRHCSSAQCTLENLRPALQRFPTLWNTLVAACFGQDPLGSKLSFKAKTSGYSDLLDYLDWREGVFFSSVRDTSILQMIPCWFPKAVRRLVQLYVQGPIGWQSLAESETEELSMLRDIYYVVNSSGHAQISATSWEAAVQKHIEEELYASSLEGAEVGLEHHLHRGRALAALDHLLSARVVKLKSNDKDSWQSETQPSGQTNIQLDVQNLLGPITQSEESLLSPVIPLAIEHFDDSVLVASCAFLLELCGLSAALLHIDISALRRISSFYKSSDNILYSQLSPKGSTFYVTPVEVDVTKSLARALADDYLHKGSSKMVQNGEGDNTTSNQPSRALLLVLQHLEKVSLPLPSSGATCGSWLASGNGDGADLRSQQKTISQQWQLVTTFCQMHNIPLSTKYLTVLARDNDWVGFLSEAQVGKYPFETVIQVASKEFSDPRLKIHILTVLRSMQSRKKISSLNIDTAERGVETVIPDENLYIPVELFGTIAECEKEERPGEALLLKAKNFSWSILAMIASCFPDVSPLSCLTVWLEITAARETSAIRVNDIASRISKNVGAAVEATNSRPANARTIALHYNRKNSKRRRLLEPSPTDSLASQSSDGSVISNIQGAICEDAEKLGDEDTKCSTDSDSIANALSRMVAVLCEQHLFLPLLQAFEIFLPSCLLLPFIRALQAFSQMRLSEASAHLGSFASRIKEETSHTQQSWEREEKVGNSWTISTAVKAADSMLLKCPSPYEKRCLLRLLAATDFGDGGSTSTRYGQLCWKIDMAEPSLRSDECPLLGNETLDDASLLDALEKNGYWEEARSWAKQLEASGEPCWKSAANHVTEMQAEAMVAEWKEYLWDVPEERAALWSHCQTLFIRYSFPALLAGQFFLKHAEAAEKDIPARELHEILLLALQWLSGMITQSNPLYPLHHLREIETRVWLLAVESEAQVKSEGEDSVTYPTRDSGATKGSNLIDCTASIVTKMDDHINAMRLKNDRDNSQTHTRTTPTSDSSFLSTKTKRRAKGFGSSRKPLADSADKKYGSESIPVILRDESLSLDGNFRIDASLSRWEERVEPAELERAVLSLLDFGQITAARQLQNKLSPDITPAEFSLVDAALKLAALSTPRNMVHVSMLDNEVRSILKSYNLLTDGWVIDPVKVLEGLSTILVEGSGRALCKRIISVVKAANMLGLTFSEAFEKQPIELLQLLSLKAQDSFEEANHLVRSHSIPAASIAQILAESFLKGLLAAHRGGYMDSQKEEGPAPLLWRFSDFLKWAELCPSDSEIGHALMRLVITGQEIPHACEVELLILSHHFYKLSSCLDGVDVLVALSATRVEAYVWEGDFSCLARLITGVGNFHALDFILGILIENGQLDLLLQKYSAAADANSGTAEAVRGFRMAVLTSLKQFNPNDLDAFAMVCKGKQSFNQLVLELREIIVCLSFWDRVIMTYRIPTEATSDSDSTFGV
ncbi:spatacsin, partial [Striga asiatica]